MYEGQVEGDLPHGEGAYTFANGTVYVGQFHQGHMHGEGKFEFPETASYDHDEYFPPGMSQPDKLRIPAGALEALLLNGKFYRPSLVVPEEPPAGEEGAGEEGGAQSKPGTAESAGGGDAESAGPPREQKAGEDALDATAATTESERGAADGADAGEKAAPLATAEAAAAPADDAPAPAPA